MLLKIQKTNNLKDIMTDRVFHTTCTMDCPDSCALEVTVAEGRIRRISGSVDDPVTAGFICSKVSRFARRVYHPDRILYPMRRIGPKGAAKFERIRWEEAIDIVAGRLRAIRDRWGGEAILPFHYGGSNGLLGEDALDDYFFARLGASRLAKTFCAAPSGEVAKAMYGKMPGVAFEDYVHAKCIVIWGANPKVSNIHLVPFLREAKKRGAFIAVVDPRNAFSRAEIDLHLPVRPGTDLPVALAMIRLWREWGRLDAEFIGKHAKHSEPLLAAADAWPVEAAAKEADVPPQGIETLARQFADADPAVIRCGWGTERNRNGGRAIAAILAMPALLGKFGKPGGGYTMSNSGAARLDLQEVFGPMSWNTRVLNMSQLGRILNEPLEPPVKALFVYNANPVATAPNQNAVIRGLMREDLFTVVHEQVMTDTARYADMVLPAVTFLEQYEIKKAYGNYRIGGVRPVIEACGEAWPNEAVFAALGRAMGWREAPFTWDTQTFLEKISGALRAGRTAVSPAKMKAGLGQRFDFPGERPVMFQTVFPQTPDGKIDLCPAVLGKDPYRYEAPKEVEFPLQLITPSSPKLISSTLGEFNLDRLEVTLHPRDARQRGIQSGDRVRVRNRLGEVHCYARVSDRVRPGVVSMPKGAWRKISLNGQTANALCPDHVNDIGGGACYNDARVEVEKLD